LDRVIENDGRPSALLKGIVESPPFLRSRRPEAAGEQTAAVVNMNSGESNHQ
jgi:hypothetical protein